MTKRKICVFIGSRANYSSLKPLMQRINDDESLELLLFLGASALLDKYGEVVKLIEQDGFRVDEYIYMLIEGVNPTTMAKSTGLGLVELPNLLYKHKPDLTLIIGDRHEMLSMAIASAFMNIPIAHTMGGEVSGTIDESIRHAITKLSHIHFPANEEARQRILQMGEHPNFVFNVGCPRMDAVKEILDRDNSEVVNGFINREGVGDNFDLQNHDFMIISQHPVTTEFDQGEKQISATLNAAHRVSQERDMPVLVLWPNADAGSDDVSRGIRKFREQVKPKNFHFFKHIPLEIYLHLMKRAAVLVGNSSSGIREGGFIGTPVVNVGSRQMGRSHGQNVMHASYDEEEIYQAIMRQLLHGHYEPEFIYGDGTASGRIIDILKNISVSPQKHFFNS